MVAGIFSVLYAGLFIYLAEVNGETVMYQPCSGIHAFTSWWLHLDLVGEAQAFGLGRLSSSLDYAFKSTLEPWVNRWPSPSLCLEMSHMDQVSKEFPSVNLLI